MLATIALPFVLAFGTASAVAAPQTGSDAVEAFRAGDYATAEELWSSALDDASVRGPERGRLLYDLGNAAFRQDRVHEAVGWYTAALRYLPRDGDVWANLEFARSEAGLEPADRGDLAATFERLLSAATLAESEWLVLGALLVLAGALAGEALRGGVAWRLAGWAGAALVVLSLGPWVYNLRAAGAERVLVVDDRAVPVRSEPREDAAQVARASSGEALRRLDELPEWVRVRAADGTEGWVPRAATFDLER